jgi:hypothetical protein
MHIKAKLWVDAYRRHVELQGGQVTIARHGDDSAGLIFLRICLPDGRDALLAPYTAMNGERRWRVMRHLQAPVAPGAERLEDHSASDVDTLLRREIKRDPDCWIVDVETRRAEHYLLEPVDGALEEES